MLMLGMLGRFHIAYMFIIGSFGASAVLIYGIPRSPLSQPRNVIGGHVLSALVGVSMHILVSDPLLCSALAVSCAILLMHITGTLHPPGGATALIATIGGNKIHDLGYLYVLSPVLCGALVMVGMALVMNNTVSGRRYPDRWW
jgi:CBS-domain-containing membrane protein